MLIEVPALNGSMVSRHIFLSSLRIYSVINNCTYTVLINFFLYISGFQKRHPNISIRVPEGCSIARAMAFNATTVATFYDKLSEVRERHDSFKDGSRVYNLDETNTSTVQNMRKVLAPKGVRQVHQIKGAERGESVTTCVVIGAYGTVLPPIHIFPRKKFNSDFLMNAYPGALGLANAKGYMTKESFIKVMEHFIKCTASSKENPSLLLLDNVDTHFSTETLELAKQNGVTVFTFPPHCTHKLQPLDVGFFGPFKTFYDNAVNTFLANNPACPPTIYRVAGFVREALSRAATPQTIIKSFEAPGIVPFNRNIFTEADFMMAQVTEKPNPPENVDVGNQDGAAVENETNSPLTNIQEDANQNVSPASVPEAANNSEETSFIGPEDIRGLPKAKPNEKKRKPRRKGKCMIATDTPEKEEIRLREEETKKKKKDLEERKKKREEKAKENKNSKSKTKRQAKKTKRVLYFESEDSEEVDDVSVHSDKAVASEISFREPEEGDFVLVKFKTGEKSCVYYVGKILSEKDSEDDLQISYYRKRVGDLSVSFTLPPKADLKSVHLNDVKVVLPKPKSAATRRQKDIISFDFDFEPYKLA